MLRLVAQAIFYGKKNPAEAGSRRVRVNLRRPLPRTSPYDNAGRGSTLAISRQLVKVLKKLGAEAVARVARHYLK